MRPQDGFTLLEGLVTLAVVSVLITLSVPYVAAASQRAVIGLTQANMHTVRHMLELYAVDWGGGYPAHLSALLDEARSGGYLKTPANPIDRGAPALLEATEGPLALDTHGLVKGAVYLGLAAPFCYALFAADPHGWTLKVQGEVFQLSNSDADHPCPVPVQDPVQSDPTPDESPAKGPKGRRHTPDPQGKALGLYR